MGRDDDFTDFAGASLRDLRRTAYLVCGDWHLAEDLAQEALIRVYRSWARIERRESLLGYARRTTVRLAIDHSRQPRRRERLGLGLGLGLGLVEEPAGPDAGAEHAVRDEVARALDGLAPRQRACLVLRFHHDCSVAETARVLGCSTGTVKSQTSDALTRLRGVLGAQLDEGSTR